MPAKYPRLPRIGGPPLPQDALRPAWKSLARHRLLKGRESWAISLCPNSWGGNRSEIHFESALHLARGHHVSRLPESRRLNGTLVAVEILVIEQVKDFPHNSRRPALAKLESLGQSDVTILVVPTAALVTGFIRSEERRVGKECR